MLVSIVLLVCSILVFNAFFIVFISLSKKPCCTVVIKGKNENLDIYLSFIRNIGSDGIYIITESEDTQFIKKYFNIKEVKRLV